MRAFVYPVKKIAFGGEKFDVHQTPRGTRVYHRSKGGTLRRLSRPQGERLLAAYLKQQEKSEAHVKKVAEAARSAPAPVRAKRASLRWWLRRWLDQLLARFLRMPRAAR